MEMLLGQPSPVAIYDSHCISSVTSHLEPPERQQQQQEEEGDGERRGMTEDKSITKTKRNVQIDERRQSSAHKYGKEFSADSSSALQRGKLVNLSAVPMVLGFPLCLCGAQPCHFQNATG